jgi:hypothetical protein
MKKVTILGVVLILLAVSVFPVMAATNQSNGHGNGQGNGHGNGVNTGQSNAGENGDQTRERDQVRTNNTGRGAIHGSHGTQNSMRMRTPFYLQGTITAKSTSGMTETLTISLTHGNAQVKEFFGTGITVTATGAAIFKIDQSNGDENEGATASTNDEGTTGDRQPITFGDLQVGQYVAIHGNLVNGVYQARLITVYIRTPLGETTENP